jgi:hypothetical protein
MVTCQDCDSRLGFRTVAFYRDGLGLPSQGIVGREFEHGVVAFFDLQSGLKLALWSRDDLAHDTGLTKTPRSATEISLGHNVGSQTIMATGSWPCAVRPLGVRMPPR